MDLRQCNCPGNKFNIIVVVLDEIYDFVVNNFSFEVVI